jgi:hypothetical protein
MQFFRKAMENMEKAHFWDLCMEKSNTKLKILTPWTPIFCAMWISLL